MTGRNLFAEDPEKPVKGGRNLLAEPEVKKRVIPDNTPTPIMDTTISQDAYANQYDALRTMLSGAAGSFEGGYKGIFEALNPFSDKPVGDTVREAQAKRTIPPETEGGQQLLEDVSDLMQPLENLRVWLGDKGYDYAGPVAGAAAYTAPDAVMSAVGLKLSTIPGMKRSKAADLNKQLQTAIKRGEIPADLAKIRISDTGRITKNPLFGAAKKQGVRENFIGEYMYATPETKQKLGSMLKLLKRGFQSGKFQSEVRPALVAGASLARRIRHLRTKNRNAGARIDKIAKTQLKNNTVDLTKAKNTFEEALDGIGVTVEKTNKGPKLNFDNSVLMGKKLSPVQKSLQDVYSRVDGGQTNAYFAHNLKRNIDEIIAWGKDAEGISANAQIVLKHLRTAINNELIQKFPKYRDANKTYSMTINALQRFQESVGKGTDLSNPGLLSQKLRSLTNNTMTRERMIPALKHMDDISAKTGRKFKDDLRVQMEFANEFDYLFGSKAATSLEGIGGRLASQAMRGDQVGAVETVITGAVDKIRGASQKGAVKALEELIK